jgi:WD40 repeat protein
VLFAAMAIMLCTAPDDRRSQRLETSQVDSNFTKVTSAPWTITVEIPGTATSKTTTTRSGQTYFEAKTTVGPATYMVTVVDLPSDRILKEPHNGMRAFRQGVYKGKGVVDERTLLWKGKVPGLEFRTEDGGRKIRERLFLDRFRLYRLVVSGSDEVVVSSEAQRFFDSFAIVKSADRPSSGVPSRPPALETVAQVPATRLVAAMQGPLRGGRVIDVAFTADDRQVVSASRALEVWDVETGRMIKEAKPMDADRMALNADGRTAFVSDRFGRELRWVDLADGNVRQTWPFSERGVVGSLSASGPIVAVEQANVITLWDAAAGKSGRRIPFAPAGQAVRGAALSPDGKMLATGGAEEFRVQLWSTADGRLVKGIKCDAAYTTAVRFSRDGRSLATGHTDATVRVWDSESGVLKGTFKSDGERRVSLPQFAVAVSPGGRLVAAAGLDYRARVWDVASGRLVAELPGRDKRAVAGAVAFSADGGRIAVGFPSTYDTPIQPRIMVWEAPGAQHAATRAGSDMPSALVFQEVVSSEDGFTVKMPGKPRVTGPEPGESRRHSYEVDAGRDGCYQVDCFDLESAMAESAPHDFLRAYQKAFVQARPGKLLEERELTADASTRGSGRTIRFRYDWGDVQVEWRLRGRRLYTLAVFGRPESVASRNAATFFNSFALLAHDRRKASDFSGKAREIPSTNSGDLRR